MQRPLQTFLALSLLAVAAAAQEKDDPQITKGNRPGHHGPPPGSSFLQLIGGSDDCANAATNDTIAGTGTFAVNTAGATTGVAPQPVGFTTIKNDVWFYWTAPTSGLARLETCGGVSVDTKAAAWTANNGTACPSGTQLAYNDDACGVQTRISWGVTAGQTYFLQLGAFTEGTTYSGTFTLQVLVPPANDVCGAPVSVSGAGPHPFDTTLATTGTEGQSEALCGSTGIARDTWFTWTAPSTATYAVYTASQTTLDTKLAVYPAVGCPAGGTALACNDDLGTSAQSLAQFGATSGQTYLIQLGQDPTNTASGGTGSFTVREVVVPTNDDCATALAISGAGPHPFDTTFATTGTQGQGVASCGPGTTFNKDLWYTWTATESGTTVVTNCGQITSTLTDTKISVYQGTPCTTGALLVCSDDAGTTNCSAQALASYAVFTAVCGDTYTIHLGNYSTSAATFISGTFTITATGGTPCGPPATPICFGDGTGAACPCGNSGAAGNGCASSVNANGGNLASSGVASIGGDTLALLGSGMPNSSALYFQGTSVLGAGAGVAFGDGLRCAGGTVIRLGTKTNVAGVSQYPAAGDTSISVRGLNAAGDFRVYQCWYRNAAAFCTVSTFNLTNAVSVTWAP